MSDADRNAHLVWRYLRVFETCDLAELSVLVSPDVVIHGAGSTVRGRHHVERSVQTPGLSQCRVRVDDLFAADDRVTVAFSLTYRHDRTGRDATMTGVKSYRIAGGQIVEFWGESDLYGLLRQIGKVPDEAPDLS